MLPDQKAQYDNRPIILYGASVESGMCPAKKTAAAGLISLAAADSSD
jgi:hypothetical protein